MLEDWPTPVDTAMMRLGGIVFRRPKIAFEAIPFSADSYYPYPYFIAVGVTAIAAGFSFSGAGHWWALVRFKQRLNLNPLAPVLATATGGALLGVTGVVRAVTAAALVHTVLARALEPALRKTWEPSGGQDTTAHGNAVVDPASIL